MPEHGFYNPKDNVCSCAPNHKLVYLWILIFFITPLDVRYVFVAHKTNHNCNAIKSTLNLILAYPHNSVCFCWVDHLLTINVDSLQQHWLQKSACQGGCKFIVDGYPPYSTHLKVAALNFHVALDKTSLWYDKVTFLQVLQYLHVTCGYFYSSRKGSELVDFT